MPIDLTVRLCEGGSVYTGPQTGFRARLSTDAIVIRYDHCQVCLQFNLISGLCELTFLCNNTGDDLACPRTYDDCNIGDSSIPGTECAPIPLTDWVNFSAGVASLPSIASIRNLWEEKTGLTTQCRVCRMVDCPLDGEFFRLQSSGGGFSRLILEVDYNGVRENYSLSPFNHITSLEAGFFVPCQSAASPGAAGWTLTHTHPAYSLTCNLTDVQCGYVEDDIDLSFYVTSPAPVGTFYNCNQPVNGGTVTFKRNGVTIATDTTDALGNYDLTGQFFIVFHYCSNLLPPRPLGCFSDVWTVEFTLPGEPSPCTIATLAPPLCSQIINATGCAATTTGNGACQVNCSDTTNCCAETSLSSLHHEGDWQLRAWRVDNRIAVVERRYNSDGTFVDTIASASETNVTKFNPEGALRHDSKVHYVFYVRKSGSTYTTRCVRSLDCGATWQAETTVTTGYQAIRARHIPNTNLWLMLGLVQNGTNCYGTLYSQLLEETSPGTFTLSGSARQIGATNGVTFSFDLERDSSDGTWRCFYVDTSGTPAVKVATNRRMDAGEAWSSAVTVTTGYEALRVRKVKDVNLWLLLLLDKDGTNCRGTLYSQLLEETAFGTFALSGAARQVSGTNDCTFAFDAEWRRDDKSWRAFYVDTQSTPIVQRKVNRKMDANEAWAAS